MSRYQLIITDHRGRPIGRADLDEHPDGFCTIEATGITRTLARKDIVFSGRNMRIRPGAKELQ